MDSKEEPNTDGDRRDMAAENSDTVALNKKRVRRVSFAELTSVHIFDRDEELNEASQLENAKMADDSPAEFGFGGLLQRSKEFGGEDDGGDNLEDEIMEMQRHFLRPIGSPSPGGSTMGSASSNDASKRVRSEHNGDKEQPASKKSCKAKGKKKVEINTNERSDFEECNEIKTKRPKLKVKIGVKTLVDAIENMKPKQLAALEEMGFSQLVHLKIRSIPAEMAFSLLENFNFNKDSSIKLLDDEPLLITEDDVHATLGLPRGELRINKERKHNKKGELSINKKRKRINKKRKRINKKRKHKTNCVIETIAEAKGKVKITSTDVKEQLDADLDGGEWFKKVFLFCWTPC